MFYDMSEKVDLKVTVYTVNPKDWFLKIYYLFIYPSIYLISACNMHLLKKLLSTFNANLRPTCGPIVCTHIVHKRLTDVTI